jgi:glucose-6-phosphate isomerase
MVKVEQFGEKMQSLDFSEIDERNKEICSKIDDRTGEGNDFLGWLDYESKLPEAEIERIEACGKRLRKNYQALAVIGIGGSYLGAKAAIDALKGLYPHDRFKIVFIGNTLSSTYTSQVLRFLKGKKFAINVISKSGTTTEPSVAFRLLKDMLEKEFGHAYLKDAIVATTDRARGALKTEADHEGYEEFVIPDDMGGRYSVISPVGLIPMAAAGINVKKFIKGVIKGEKEYSTPNYKKNPAYKYGAVRYLLNKMGYPVEMFVSYEPQFASINEWLKQLFAESEGKDGKGLLPDSVTFTTDLHSVGQFIQQGSKIMFETIIKTDEPIEDLTMMADKEDLDGLNYLSGKNLSFINDKAFEGTLKAHVETGGVPANVIHVKKMDAAALGNLFYFFMRACAYSAYLLGVNPFNQPGVEIYKHNMFVLLGKPGVK